jgi:hypothetical protein
MIHATYWKDDDILEVRFSDKAIARSLRELARPQELRR